MYVRFITYSMAAIAALLLLFVYAHHVLAVLAYQIDYGEGFILDSAVRLASGEQLCPSMSEAAPHPSLYPPLFYSFYAVLNGKSGDVVDALGGLPPS